MVGETVGEPVQLWHAHSHKLNQIPPQGIVSCVAVAQNAHRRAPVPNVKNLQKGRGSTKMRCQRPHLQREVGLFRLHQRVGDGVHRLEPDCVATLVRSSELVGWLDRRPIFPA